ncbi:hypothetical protein KVR01_004887 [Diaporthe batatas]|uniref:uncharacterized protein n=1 Tax=Diaporthe batatas TaxID=748121 RepID=UPI001D040DC0|nr:uncharacterized protein KVR01_004887 [Diaporthe batatas]KAG8164612.1 hypothetical protein KVR01_004887 [Diaporthe batatas]
MRHEAMPSDLSILSAEQYLDGPFSGRTSRAKKPSTSKPETAPRKRAKVSPPTAETESAEDGDDDGAKRARGRPRIDTKDQTAAERRRTQIRLAQRAYRSRKENAIQTLERRVEELQGNNEELSHIFLKLHDSAVNLGVLEQSPRFANELRTATEKILSLARRSSEDGGQDEQTEGSAPEPPPRGSQTEDSSSSDVPIVQTARNSTVPLWGGYMVAHEAETTAPDVSMALPSNTIMSVPQTPLGYEIVTMPTFENASFPFDLNPESSYPNMLEQASTASPAYPISPYSSLPLPQSMAFEESTFGRRLQRICLELAYRLLTMPDPPKQAYASTFGFCLLFEPAEKIRERLAQCLQRTSSESLNWWQAPFWAAGGSGQHQLQQGTSASAGASNEARVGNQGTVDQMKYQYPGGQFGLGPFDAKVSETRDKRIDPRMRIRLPGFEGDFYDPEEVEVYLQARGVVIHPGQDYLTTEVDVASFKNGAAAGQDSQGQGQEQAAGRFEDWSRTLDEAFDNPAPSGSSPNGSQAVTSASTSSTTVGMDTGTWPIDTFTEMFSRATAGHGMSGLGSGSGTPTDGGKKLITLDVNVFLSELARRGTCLGRSPGFRPSAVDAAFWTATKTGAELGF